MKVTESSESVLAGTKRPPFRLVCRALSATGARLPIRPVVSEEFVVSICTTLMRNYSMGQLVTLMRLFLCLRDSLCQCYSLSAVSYGVEFTTSGCGLLMRSY